MEKPNYKSNEYLSELSEKVELFMPNLLSDNVKPKNESKIRDFFSDLYGKNNMEVLKTIKDIKVSHLLGLNEVVVQPMVEEYKRLETQVTLLKKEYEGAKQFQDIWPQTQEIMKVLDKNKIKQCLFDDLKELKEYFGLDFDIKEEINKEPQKNIESKDKKKNKLKK